MSLLTPEQLAALQAIDTPTICNAIETFRVRGRMQGFMGMDIRCLFPELGTMIGYALTVVVDSTTPDVPADENVWRQWVQAMYDAPKPIVLVFKDGGTDPRKSAHAGEVMATLARRLGVVGFVTDGGLRDINEVRALGIHYFCAGVVPSHGNPRLLEVNVPVTLDGVRVEPGDLVHGDVNGVTLIPREIADRVAAAAEQVREREGAMMNYIKSDDFDLQEYFKRRTQH
jgi:regulator of RNase E activity RraA